jgi:hypothetical protein
MSAAPISAVAAAEEEADAPTADKPTSEVSESAQAIPAAAGMPPTETSTAPVAPPPTTEAKPADPLEGWHTEVHGYFRAPMALGISSRSDPNEMGRVDAKNNKIPDGSAHTQISYGSSRVMDWSYYSFAYTRLQEQDWAELTFHMKNKHVDAAVGWMGYWLAATGFRDPDAAATPGVASLTLDSDFEVAGVTSNIAFQMGAWWPSYGYFEKYDTFTLGRFRQIGEELRLTVSLDPDLKVTLVEGFGTGRDGSYDYGIAKDSPLYAAKVGADLIAWGNLKVAYKKYADIGLHYNYEFTRDPYMFVGSTAGKTYSDAAQAHLSVVGAEANLTLPNWGHLWISPSYISVKNGWALAGGGGTEVMHAQNALGLAANYLQWNGDPPSSTGTGSMFNLGLLYENTLANALGVAPGSVPDLRLSVFGLLVDSTLDLPRGSSITLKSVRQLKYGADLTYQALDWFALMLRGDTVNYDLDVPGYIFSAITGRLVFSSHYLSRGRIYLQYSRYIYGDNMLLAGTWQTQDGGGGWPLVAGAGSTQANSYAGTKPDENIIKLQAEFAF